MRWAFHFRYQNFQRTADQILGSVAENRFTCRIRIDDCLRLVDGQDSVRYSVNNLTEKPFQFQTPRTTCVCSAKPRFQTKSARKFKKGGTQVPADKSIQKLMLCKHLVGQNQPVRSRRECMTPTHNSSASA